jgi:hypothetical protein
VISCTNIQNASVTGLGTIDGQGYIKDFPTNGPRHNNIRLLRCWNMVVRDVTLINAPAWVFKIQECDGVTVTGVKIYSFTNENNDGIDIEGKNIIITGCTIDCDDDAICLKSDRAGFVVENVSISNCIIGSNCNAIKFGTSSRTGFRNVAISNCVIRRPSESAHRQWSKSIKGVSNDTTVISGLALEVVDGGFMDQVTVTNLTMTGVQTPLFIRLGNRNGAGTLKNVVISNIIATNESLITSSITGVPGSYAENIIIRDIIFNYKGTATLAEAQKPVAENEKTYPENRMFGYSLPSYGLYVRHVKNLSIDNFKLNLLAPDSRPAIILDDCHNVSLRNFQADFPDGDQPLIKLISSTGITISGFTAAKTVPELLRIEGEETSGIMITGNDLSKVKNLFKAVKCNTSEIKEMNNFK